MVEVKQKKIFLRKTIDKRQSFVIRIKIRVYEVIKDGILD